MKKLYSLLSICFLLSLSSQVSANEVIVKGYLKTANGAAVINQEVKVSIDSTVSTCRQSKVVKTDQNGFYSTTLGCSINFARVIISTLNCNGTWIVEQPQVPPSGVIERNFITCQTPPVNCEAAFRFEKSNANPLLYHFNSSTSHGATAADNIVKRRWRFGDGSVLEGNEVSPTHTYAAKGIYEVCLTIITAAGCEKTICYKIEIEGAPTHCEASFRFEKSGTVANKYHFNSSASKGSTATDNIVKRRWRFGDGTVLEGNEITPTHTYAGKGIYEVCLTIITAAGCEKTTCQKITIEENTACKAEFTFIPSAGNYKEIKFNSSTSAAGAGDNIISRLWHFGDGKTATTVDPVHLYEKEGVYHVCLVIKTAAGCVKEFCKTIEIKTRTCAAAFVYEHIGYTASIAGYSVRFNSNKSTSNDSIVSRNWTFGDGTTSTSAEPLHKFEKPGLYNVCLVIKTRNGCESKECKQVLVGPNAVINCTPKITFERIQPKNIRFNSNTSVVAAGDEIISRSWFFGDGTSITTGNQVSVLKEYTRPGNYTVCLYIKTRNGCENKVCITVKIEESTATISEDRIKIVTIYPTPVHTQMTTEVWSLHNNINATLAIYDIYGVKKWEEKKVLLQGTNVNVVATGFLLPGPYLFKVTTMYGVRTRQFYKM